jgi:hydroxypyruvate isomerase
MSRPQAEQQAVAAALRDTGLAAGVVVWTSRQVYRQPLWGSSGASAWEKIAAELERAMAAATSIGASVIGVVNVADPTRDIVAQRSAMADHLLRAADLLARQGMIIGLEPMVIVPNMLLKTFDDGLQMLERVRHPAVRLIFDTAHVIDGGDDVPQTLRASYDKLCLVQLADHPGRLEPGTGSVDFQSVLHELLSNNYRGLVELEHFWSATGPETERAGLQRLRALESAAQTSHRT